MVDTKVFTGSREISGVGRKQMWYRGRSARVKMELTDQGRVISISPHPESSDNLRSIINRVAAWLCDVARQRAQEAPLEPAGDESLP